MQKSNHYILITQFLEQLEAKIIKHYSLSEHSLQLKGLESGFQTR